MATQGSSVEDLHRLDHAPAGTEFAADNEFSIKVLVPGYSVGGLLGKGGATITQLQADTSTRIRISAACT